MAARVFISHSSHDSAAALSLKNALTALDMSAFIAPDDISTNQSWAQQIAEAIANCDAMIVLISAAANGSEHVAREVSIAVHEGKPIVPVRLEKVEPTGSLQYLLQLIQWVDAFPGSVQRHAAQITSRTRSVIASTPDAPDLPAITPAKRWKATPLLLVVAGFGAVLLVVIAAAVLLRTRPSVPSIASATATASLSATAKPPLAFVATPFPSTIVLGQQLGRTLESAPIQLGINWAVNDAAQVKEYELQFRANDDAFADVAAGAVPGTTISELPYSSQNLSSYQLRVRAFPFGGAPTAWCTGSAFSVTQFQENKQQFSFSPDGAWTLAPTDYAYGDDGGYAVERTTSPNAKMTLQGTSGAYVLGVVATEGPGMGAFNVYDGATLLGDTPTDLSAAALDRVVVYTSPRKIQSDVSVVTVDASPVEIDAFLMVTDPETSMPASDCGSAP